MHPDEVAAGVLGLRHSCPGSVRTAAAARSSVGRHVLHFVRQSRRLVDRQFNFSKSLLALVLFVESLFGLFAAGDVFERADVSDNFSIRHKPGGTRVNPAHLAQRIQNSKFTFKIHALGGATLPFLEDPMAVSGVNDKSPRLPEGFFLGQSGDLVPARIGVQTPALLVRLENPDRR